MGKIKSINLIWFFIMIFGLLIIAISMTTCSNISNKNETIYVLETLPPTPDYIMLVTPTKISKALYDKEARTEKLILVRGIAISLWANQAGIIEENRNWETISKRVSLNIDGEKISNETLVGGIDGEIGGEIVRISWVPELSLGIHEAKFSFINDTGEILEYSWQFLVEP